MDAEATIAVTVVGGYLGAGKTTLLNHLLTIADERVAVLVNDFGELDIDAQLLARADGNTVTLPNGCICCSLVDGLASALADLAELTPRPDRVVIEASGVADPAGIAAYCHRSPYRLDLVIVLVDGAAIEQQIDDGYVGETVRGQLRAADLLVINKADLADPAAAQAICDHLAPDVPTITTSDGQLDPRVLIGLAHRATGDEPSFHEDALPFASWSYADEVERGIDELRAIIDAFPGGVVRVKGLARTPDGRRVVIQVAAGRVSLDIDDEACPPGLQLVAIGTPGALDDQSLAALID